MHAPCETIGDRLSDPIYSMNTHKPSAAKLSCILAILLACAAAQARVTKIVIDETVSPAFCKGGACASYGAAGQYEQIAGRAWGELDPTDPLNSLVQDIQLAKDPDGKVRYVATFVITRPLDMGKASGMLWHEVPNRGRPVLISAQEREFGEEVAQRRGRVGVASIQGREGVESHRSKISVNTAVVAVLNHHTTDHALQ